MNQKETSKILKEDREQRKVKKLQEDAYNKYVEKVTPTHSLVKNMARAFLVGGLICCMGQWIMNEVMRLGIDRDTAGSWTSLILVLLSVILTGLNLYPGIAKFGGAGALVPITGFANSVAAPAIEFQKEGQVYGIGTRIFSIAGPVILYGIFCSWVLGLGCWLIMMFF